MMTLRDLWTRLGRATLRGGSNPHFRRVVTDTRQLVPHDLFVALRGERFDGHRFVDKAFLNGAAACVVDRESLTEARIPTDRVLVVEDTLTFLAEFASDWRRRIAPKVLTVAGSNGKTTVKEMLASCMQADHGAESVLVTPGNLNNAIGLPLTLLSLRHCHRVAIVEIGSNHPGEIAQLAAIAQADVAVVTNAQREHQEFFDGALGSAHENAASIEALGAEGIAVYPGDDLGTEVFAQAASSRKQVRFGSQSVPQGEPRSNVQVVMVEALESLVNGWKIKLSTPHGTLQTTLHALGEHSLRNAAAACAGSLALGASFDAITTGLACFRPVRGRMVWHKNALSTLVIDDTYNANPDSVIAAIKVLAAQSGPKLLVLGDMGEVGAQSEALHHEVGECARRYGIDSLQTLGSASRHAADAFGQNASHWTDRDEFLRQLPSIATGFKSILLKGSRFMRMEEFLPLLLSVAPASNEQVCPGVSFDVAAH